MIAPEWPFRRTSRSPITLEIGRNSRRLDALKYHSIQQLRVVRVSLPHGLATRQVCFHGCTANPGGPWMAQMARNLTDAFDGFLRAPVRYVLMDRDTKFTAEFQAILTAADVKPVLLPPKSPNCNAHLERFFRSLKDEALSRIIFFGETALREAVNEFLIHYNGERAHQGLDHQILQPGPEVGQKTGVIACRERLGGVLKYYHRQAA
jgi:putative transposase